MKQKTDAYLITVKGLVQGVGFRPYVYRLANRLGFNGRVENRTDGVVILLESNGTPVEIFTELLKREAPPASDIESLTVESIKTMKTSAFCIVRSTESPLGVTEISPDIAVCRECRYDMQHQPHRRDYPLINCTHCGPRFSIIEALPYDRPNTTMAAFEMCKRCNAEYINLHDRRFHAQPVACNHCGPVYNITQDGDIKKQYAIHEIIRVITERLLNSETIALKGTGGYHLICNALDPVAVERLRQNKKRGGKPLAVMFRNINAVRKYATVTKTELELLASWRRPVVLLSSKGKLPASINSGLNTIGAILPYMPMHYLVFKALTTPAIVFTSGNISEEPVEIDDITVQENLGSITQTFVSYNRRIHNRVDDSVVRIIHNQPAMIRRSRGYVPKPVYLSLPAEGILAVGAELKNTFCIGKGNHAIMSQHIGDLKNHETFSFFTETVERFRKLFRFQLALIAADQHPDYLPTQFADSLGFPVVRVQHHHAHIASCMAEHQLDEPVIGLAFDGTGLGDDGHSWGSEVMLAGLNNYSRLTHMDYIPLAGGDKAVEEPWRIAVALLYQTFGDEGISLATHLFPKIPGTRILSVVESLQKNINITLSSGLGRLFDAVAALTGLCLHPSFEAEGPMQLEAIADKSVRSSYPVVIDEVLRLEPIIRALLNDLLNHIPAPVISARFHNTVAAFAIQGVLWAEQEHGVRKVVLSGGSFQNRILAEKIITGLNKHNFTTFTQTKVPPNDGGISLGQLAVAAKRRELSCA